MNRLLCTSASLELFVVRVGLGAVMLPHGMQKLFGWFGGHGFGPTIESFTGMGIPWVLALMVVLAESFGAVALIIGFLTRPAAIGIAAVMIGAIQMVHWGQGFFMNWSGQQSGEGFEYHLLVLAMCLALLIGGGGRWSLDARLCVERDR